TADPASVFKTGYRSCSSILTYLLSAFSPSDVPEHLTDRAGKSAGKLDPASLSHNQLREKLESAEKEMQQEKLKVSMPPGLFLASVSPKEHGRRSSTSSVRVISPGGIVFARTRTDFHRITEKLLEMVQKALDGTYHAHSYSDLELDLTTAIYELGGGAALYYALHKSPFAFSARITLIERCQDFRLRITVGAVTMTDILANIDNVQRRPACGPKSGNDAFDGRGCRRRSAVLPARD
ncbi:hypothetical protein BDZ97DRAFT_1992409, partial [Flammula alnicola]